MELELQNRKNIVYKKSNLEEWGKFLVAMDSGKQVEIDEEMYFYWLGLLSPLKQGKDFFYFAEGDDDVIRFWLEQDRGNQNRYYCKNTFDKNIPLKNNRKFLI